MMTLKPKFQQMSRKELRTYVLTHRKDEEALRIYMERLHNESGVIRQIGGLNEEDLNQLEEMIKRRVAIADFVVRSLSRQKCDRPLCFCQIGDRTLHSIS